MFHTVKYDIKLKKKKKIVKKKKKKLEVAVKEALFFILGR